MGDSLKFFDKDPIEWKPYPFYDLYKKLFVLKHSNQALWNGEWGGPMLRIYNDKQDKVVSFCREKSGNSILPVINFSNEPVTATLHAPHFTGDYTEYFSGKKYELKGEDKITLPAWGYMVFVK